jgi:polyhydroxyalkanoate synthesis regulator phasin
MTIDSPTGASSSFPFEDGRKVLLAGTDESDIGYLHHVEMGYQDEYPPQILHVKNGTDAHLQIGNHLVGEINDVAVTSLEASSLSDRSSSMSSSSQNPSQRKRRSNNPAMGDTAFLRKRTSDILRVTSPDHLVNVGIGESKDMDGSDDETSSVVLGRGMKVGLKTFNFLIDAWAFSGELDAADQALRLLDRMEELHSRQGELEEAHSDHLKICPDVRSYTKVINALSRSMRPDAGELAEGILNKMEHIYSTGENPAARPNTYTYTAAIEAYANSGIEGSLEKTEELLERMIARYQSGDPEVLPNARCFNAAISAYAKSDSPGAAQQAEYWLNRMDGLYMAGLADAKPNSFNYNSLITAWANCPDDEGSAQKAAEVLERMEQCYAFGDPACRPTTVSFNAVIDAYAKSRLDDAAERAEQVLRRMEDLYEAGEDVKPNTRSFNSVMNAWAKSGKGDAAEKAQDLLDFMTQLYEAGNEAVRPDVHSFCTVINGMFVVSS